MQVSVGIFSRVHRQPAAPFTPTSAVAHGRPSWMVEGLEAHLCDRGYVVLNVVGESHYQEALWRVVGGRRTGGVRCEARAILVAENDNSVDHNAVSVWIYGMLSGYVAREDAARLRPGLLELQARVGKPVALEGELVGRDLGTRQVTNIGVFLDYDPTEFGLFDAPHTRTGLHSARKTLAGPLSVIADLPPDPRERAAHLRTVLQRERLPLVRHFLFIELEETLYRCRELGPQFLQEFDQVCLVHHAEMSQVLPEAAVRRGPRSQPADLPTSVYPLHQGGGTRPGAVVG
jgi:hypothetical protein